MQRQIAVATKATDAGPEEPERLVRAAVIDPRDIRVYKRANGDDWLLGSGSFGTVSPSLCVVPTLVWLTCLCCVVFCFCCFCLRDHNSVPVMRPYPC